jgi:hypothetical protein
MLRADKLVKLVNSIDGTMNMYHIFLKLALGQLLNYAEMYIDLYSIMCSKFLRTTYLCKPSFDLLM